MASAEQSIHGILASSAEPVSADDLLDKTIAEIANSGVIFWPNKRAREALQHPDTQAVARLFAKLVHPSNQSGETFLTKIPIPPDWNHPEQNHFYSHGTLGIVV